MPSDMSAGTKPARSKHGQLSPEDLGSTNAEGFQGSPDEHDPATWATHRDGLLIGACVSGHLDDDVRPVAARQ